MDGHGTVVPATFARVAFLTELNDYSVVSPISDNGGFINVAIKFSYIKNVTDPRVADFHLMFVVDGVASNVSSRIVPDTTVGARGVCSDFIFSAPVSGWRGSQFLFPTCFCSVACLTFGITARFRDLSARSFRQVPPTTTWSPSRPSRLWTAS